ncbi:MAG: hypothetical protein E7605_09240 [Ruminococcaceae bacterium]|nr:hypothetical protein [Oscillospiraceae bacterium]
MKRVSALVFTIVVLLLCFCLPVGAMKADEGSEPYRSSVVIWDADEGWGDEFELDTKNQLEGQGCASLDLHASEGVHRAQRSIAPADATGMDTLEFDLYLSNITHVRDFRAPNRQGALVIASEKGALHFDMRILLCMIEDHDLVRGWNHIVIPLDPLAIYLGEFDASRINQISIYWESTAWFEERSIIKFDRFMLTDRDAVAKEDPTVKQTLGAYVDLLARIKENYVACIMLPRIGVFESDVDAAPLLEQCMTNINSYSEIPEKDKALLDAKGYGLILSESRFHAKEYQDAKETLMQIPDVVLQFLSLREYAEEGALTSTNFRDVYERTTLVRTTYEGLYRKQKSALWEQGYLSILEAVENALQMHTHDFVLEVATDEYLASPASCTSGALYYYSCAFCGEKGTEAFEYGEPKEHNPSEGYVLYHPDGHAMQCEDCRGCVGKYVPHTFSDWIIVREATETQQGCRSRQCAVCPYVESEDIPKISSSTAPDSDTSDVPETPEDPEIPDAPETPQTPAVPVAPSDDGCSAVLVSGAPAMLALIAAAGWMLRKKKQ